MTIEEGVKKFSPMERAIVRAAIEAVKPLGTVRWADETAEYLYVKIDGERGKSWIRFIEGNGVDVISDYGVGLENVLAPVFRLVESLERGEYEITPSAPMTAEEKADFENDLAAEDAILADMEGGE